MGAAASSLLCGGTGAVTPSSLMATANGSAAPPQQPTASASNPFEIFLESDNLVLRGQGGDMAPAMLSGYVSLYLAESTNIKDITMTLTGKAKVHFQDATR